MGNTMLVQSIEENQICVIIQETNEKTFVAKYEDIHGVYFYNSDMNKQYCRKDGWFVGDATYFEGIANVVRNCPNCQAPNTKKESLRPYTCRYCWSEEDTEY